MFRSSRSSAVLVLSLMLVIAGLPGCGASSSPSSPSSPSAPAYVISATELADMLSEKVLGDAAATVSVIQYSSPTCPHCATFHLTTLPQIKAAYIDTRKAKLVYRDFPVSGASTITAAYAASALARCAGSARYFEALDLLYRNQAAWTGASDPKAAMKQVLAPLGMASDKMDACVASTDIQGDINRVMAEARSTYQISAVPTFVIGDQKIVGSAPYADFDAVLKTLIK